MIIQSEEDLRQLQGKFVLQIDNETPDKTLMDFNWEFAKEKRLYLISNFGFIDLYGQRSECVDFEAFKDRFNSYLFKHMKEKGMTDGGRFHRLLASKELAYLFEKIKAENY